MFSTEERILFIRLSGSSLPNPVSLEFTVPENNNDATATLTAGEAGSQPALHDLVIVGGCGHVGLPLALSFADAGLRVGIYDIDAAKVASVREGKMPFMERGSDELLTKVLATDRLTISSDPSILSETDVTVLVVGTPIDEFMNPSMTLFEKVVDEIAPTLRPGSLVILRSTVYPGTTEYVEDRLHSHGIQADVVFCPERIAEGYALEEIKSLPQLIGTTTDHGFDRAVGIFKNLGVEILRTTPKEAELAKLLTNTWRYMKFAIANQFFQIAHSNGVDYDKVLHSVRHNYPRASDLPAPGFAAGPCLLKDTMQLSAFSPDNFPMGQAAMIVNEGLPGYIVDTLDNRQPLRGRTLGILGMAFKGESDDPRTSLSYKLRKLAAFKGAEVLCSDPYVQDAKLVPEEEVMRRADIVVIGAPHKRYRELDFSGKELVDVWSMTDRGINV
ncbi:MAG: UDP-N-acetyl-D-mannosaminuronic acid dehydrogenase [Chloroflexota bacterium]|jgi:UDP-N-acetyl-D-mannosaminuronic acid dehydrogenase|nr:UDP-N-acetyl-D-mannosaminuronic acid dehydrogenase [Chloroflexota bacterium]